MELGATVCLPASPLCLTCPLLALCQTKSDALPLPKAKPARRQVSMTLFLFMQAGKAALVRRTAGVLQGMYGFYFVEEALSPAAARQKLQKAGLQNFALGAPQAHRHVFTHIEWDMAAYPVQLPPPAPADAAPQGFSPQPRGPLPQPLPKVFLLPPSTPPLPPPPMPTPRRWNGTPPQRSAKTSPFPPPSAGACPFYGKKGRRKDKGLRAFLKK